VAVSSAFLTMSHTLHRARVDLLQRLGLERAPLHFEEALTHPSYANEHKADGVVDNQRLEFLGDAVLDLCVSELLLEKLPDSDEGTLSRAYGGLVNGESLARWARDNGVGPALQVGKGAASTGISDRTNVLADAVEALVAAVYLDGGLAAARGVAELIITDGLSDATELGRRDAKTALQELVQARGAPAPAYHVVAVEGPDHDRRFVMSVEIGGSMVAEGKGRTKKLAEQAAASAALELAQSGGLSAQGSEGESGAKKKEGPP
jgi:ribonuclease-3